MADLTLHTNPQSRGRIAHWMMEELGQPCETVWLEYGPPMKSAEYLALNPMGKVPTVTHGAHVITECAAICAYLADTFPKAGLMPANRASFYRWMFFGAGPPEQAVTNQALKVEVPIERRGMVGYGSFDRVIRTLTAHLAQTPCFCGDTFSAADVYVGSQVGWGLQFGTLPAEPAFTSYWDRVNTRPALGRASAANAAAIAQKG